MSERQLVEHFFRHESANLIAVLTRAYGVRRLGLIEDTVQAALLEAMESWKQRGVPDNPAAWVHRVARNRLIDALRREQVHQRAMALAQHDEAIESELVEEWLEEERLPDSTLRMMFVCCHPSLDRKSQIALTLKILGGFSVSEIARGMITPAETIKKRLQRGKRRLAEQNLQVTLPPVDELAERLDVVHDVLYLMFNEGYSASSGHDPIRDDLCEEAARLCYLLCEHSLGNQATFALLALMLYHGARLESRVSPTGNVVLLEDQDRSQWDRPLIEVADRWLSRAGQATSRFHLEAAIACIHCQAANLRETHWSAVITLYEQLQLRFPSPIYLLNRAIALGEAGRLDEAQEELTHLESSDQLASYHLLHCAWARWHELAGAPAKAESYYRSALKQTTAAHEQSLIESKIAKLSGES